jgi:hypothetical protein
MGGLMRAAWTQGGMSCQVWGLIGIVLVPANHGSDCMIPL